MGDAMCVAVGNPFAFCIGSLTPVVGLSVATAIVVAAAVVVFVLQECGD